MKRIFAILGLVVVGGFSLAVLALAEPLILALRPWRPDARAEDLSDLDEDDPGVDVDGAP